MSATTGGVVGEDRLVRRQNIIIRFPNGGPDLQFYGKVDENDTNQRWRYTLAWQELLEYEDTNQNGAYDPLNDTLVHQVNLRTLTYDFSSPVVNLTGISGEMVTGRHFEFVGSFLLNSTEVEVRLLAGWWEGAVLHPYGNDTVVVGEQEAKFAVEVTGWSFSNQTNRLALVVQVLTTTPVAKYDVSYHTNGTFSMITKEDPDGMGKRGGIINNPSKVFLDNESWGEVNLAVGQNSSSVQLQYNFGAFTESLLYDPTYSAVASVVGMTTTTGDITGDTETNVGEDDNTAIPGFLVPMLGVALVVLRRLPRRGS